MHVTVTACSNLDGERGGRENDPLARYCWKENPEVTMVTEPSMGLHCSVLILSCMHGGLQDDRISA